MAYGRVSRAVCGVLAGGLLLIGCSGSKADDPPGRPGPAGTGSAPPGVGSPGAGPAALSESPPRLDFDPDPARAPKDPAAARELAEAVVAGPDLWGPGFVRRTPFLSPPGYWPVLDETCAWQGGTPPSDVLYSLTAHSELPAAGGKGPLRVAATVTVHREVADAEWEMADTLEEALRCPGQKLRDGERIRGLMSIGYGFGTGGNLVAEDAIGEVGEFVSDAFGGKPYEYGWFQSRLGQVTVAAVTKGAEGHAAKEIHTARVEAMTRMMNRLEKRLEGAE
ncbi:hypothetical protein [Streptomyces sp. CAU 1734]|uniref:hypothetical protein n=1 Tax=Streptomyces sp. CAU 1734 TaxID=3140360 RepID=UPI003261604A